MLVDATHHTSIGSDALMIQVGPAETATIPWDLETYACDTTANGGVILRRGNTLTHMPLS